MRQLSVMLEELKRLVAYYTEQEEKEKDMGMRSYYAGKLDAFSHSLMMLNMAIKDMEREDEELIQEMCNKWDNENEQ